MKTVLVTGANGLLGQKLVRILAHDASLHTVATARQPLHASAQPVHFRILDITDKAQVNALMQVIKPNVVINTAAATQVDWCELHRDECFRINTEAVSFLLKACEQIGSTFIQLSTDFIFDGTRGPLDESAPPNPINVYGLSKLKAEQLVMHSSIPWCIIRTALVYGVVKPLTRPNIVLWVKESLEQGKKIQVVTDQKRTPTLAEDLAQGCYLAIKNNATGIFHISGEEMMSPFDLAVRTARFFSLDETLIIPADFTSFRQPATRPPITGFIVDKAKQTLGYQPHSLIEGLNLVKQQLAE